MPAPRRNPPKDAAETIRELATRGFSLVGIASQFGVSKDMLKGWIERYPLIADAFEIGKDAQRQALHEMLYQKALAKNDTLAALSILNSLHGWRPESGKGVNVNVDVKVQNVMVVTDHGTDAEWAAKSASQQAALVLDAGSPPKTLPTPKVIEDAIVILPQETYPAWYPVANRKPPAPPVPLDAPEYVSASNGQPQPPTPTAPQVWRSNS